MLDEQANPPSGSLSPARAPSLILHHHSENIAAINIGLKMFQLLPWSVSTPEAQLTFRALGLCLVRSKNILV